MADFAFRMRGPELEMEGMDVDPDEEFRRFQEAERKKERARAEAKAKSVEAEGVAVAAAPVTAGTTPAVDSKSPVSVVAPAPQPAAPTTAAAPGAGVAAPPKKTFTITIDIDDDQLKQFGNSLIPAKPVVVQDTADKRHRLRMEEACRKPAPVAKHRSPTKEVPATVVKKMNDPARAEKASFVKGRGKGDARENAVTPPPRVVLEAAPAAAGDGWSGAPRRVALPTRISAGRAARDSDDEAGSVASSGEEEEDVDKPTSPRRAQGAGAAEAGDVAADAWHIDLEDAETAHQRVESDAYVKYNADASVQFKRQPAMTALAASRMIRKQWETTLSASEKNKYMHAAWLESGLPPIPKSKHTIYTEVTERHGVAPPKEVLQMNQNRAGIQVLMQTLAASIAEEIEHLYADGLTRWWKAVILQRRVERCGHIWSPGLHNKWPHRGEFVRIVRALMMLSLSDAEGNPVAPTTLSVGVHNLPLELLFLVIESLATMYPMRREAVEVEEEEPDSGRPAKVMLIE